MAEAPAPTYHSEHRGDRDVYVCVVPDANHASGTCDHWSPTYDLMAQHQQQRHGGDMIEAPPEEDVPDEDGPQDEEGASSASPAAASASVETATPAPPPPPPTPTSQRTADAQEHPPQASVG